MIANEFVSIPGFQLNLDDKPARASVVLVYPTPVEIPRFGFPPDFNCNFERRN